MTFFFKAGGTVEQIVLFHIPWTSAVFARKRGSCGDFLSKGRYGIQVRTVK